MTLLGSGVPTGIPCQPDAHSDGVMAVPIENIGTGPALVVAATVNMRNDDGTSGASGEATPGGVRADGRVPLLFEIAGLRGGPAPGYQLELTYMDVANTSWQTLDSFDPSERAYEGATITRRAYPGVRCVGSIPTVSTSVSTVSTTVSTVPIIWLEKARFCQSSGETFSSASSQRP
jgi:hypothetical protein